MKSLVSSLDLRHPSTTILPLTAVAEEILRWVELASGVDAWKKTANRNSLDQDIAQSAGALGVHLGSHIANELAAFQASFAALSLSGTAVLSQPPGASRVAPQWVAMLTATQNLLTALKSDDAVIASWDDLVAVAQNRALEGREYRPIADLLTDQLRHRGLEAESMVRGLVSIMAFGRDPEEMSFDGADTSYTDRLEQARAYVVTPATIEPVTVWLGYKGRVGVEMTAGRVSFYEPLWAIPNAQPGRQEFDHKEELWDIVKDGFSFRVPELADEKGDVETLVRVDLGSTTAAGAVERASAIVDIIINVALHRSGGIRPQLTEHVVVRSGVPSSFGHSAVWDRTGFPDDTYGAGMTSDAINAHGPRIANALAQQQLPRFLAAAIEVQTTLDLPFSRDMALRKPSEADISSVIPLSDRIVQHIAAHAAMDPNDLFQLLGEKWAHARWLSDLEVAARMCLLGGGVDHALHHSLTVEWHSSHPKQPWILFLDDRRDDFLSLCRLEHERAWIQRMFDSISNHAKYSALISEYEDEGAVLEARRRRLRNALVHGNPAAFTVVESVRSFAEFTSGTALYIALESFVEMTDPQNALAERTDEFIALQGGTTAAIYWRERVKNEGWPFPA
ncbi:hypothetical protein QMQ05_03305 [Glutamicibacter ectropisis]|uniref:Apea-like HEPN domain-containing protein n=1 Tax=Glutamicibacter ectropisis TaxID=3046593 RepID=A0AAU6WGF4_9MICC